jgi:hypothetical protein
MPKLALAVLIVSGLPFENDATAQTPSTEGNSKNGSICVLPNLPEPPTRISSGGEYNPHTLTVRINKGQSIRWPHNEPLLIDNLDLQEKHRVVLASDGKRIQSFRFKFSEEDEARLCIYFDGYQGVQLGNRKDAFWCKAKTRACWH